MGGEATTHPCREEAGGVRQSPPRAEGGHAGKCERWAQGGGHGFGRLMSEAGRTDTEAGHHACGQRGRNIRWVWALTAKQGGGEARGRARLPTNEDGRALALPGHDCWRSERPHPPDGAPEGVALGAGMMPLQGLILT